VAALREEIRAFQAGPATPAPFPGEHEKIHAASYPNSESKRIHLAAVEILKANPAMSYRAAVELVTRRRA
jgi:hypothetical protein